MKNQIKHLEINNKSTKLGILLTFTHLKYFARRMAKVAQKCEGPSPKSLDLDENVKP